MNKIIDGINVLKQIPIKDYTLLARIAFALGITTVIIFLIIFIKQTPEREIYSGDIRLKRLCVGCGIGFTICILSIIHFPWFYAETGRYTYQCKLGNNISANYISDNFNVVSVEDKIWTIKDK